MNDTLRQKKQTLYRISVSGIFLALAVVVKLTTTFYLPIMGATGLKIDFSQIFTAFPAILFGPVCGGIVFAVADILGYLIKPEGAFLPLLTLTQFVTGFGIGFFFSLFERDKRRGKIIRPLTAFALALLVISGAFGVANHISLNSDGVIHGLLPKTEELHDMRKESPDKLNFFSSSVVSLAKYNNNTVTVVKYTDRSDTTLAVIPSYIDDCKVTAIASGAFDGLDTLTEIYIPATVTTIPDGLLDRYRDVITVRTEEDSTAAKYAAKARLNTVEMSSDENAAFIERINGESEIWYPKDYTVSTNYQKNLNGYIIFMTFGLEGIALLGITLILCTKLQKEYSALFFFGVIAPTRLVITIINTEILRHALLVWNGRSFLILLIPRLGEELVSCIIQAWAISLLYGVYKNQIEKKARKI